DETRTHKFYISNPNPIPVPIIDWDLELPQKQPGGKLSLSLLKVLENETEVPTLATVISSSENVGAIHPDIKVMRCKLILAPGYKALFELNLQTTIEEEQHVAIIIKTAFNTLWIPVH